MKVKMVKSREKRKRSSEMKSSVQFSPNKHLENISKLFRNLYNDDQMADVTLCCKDGTIKAHKLVLAASSPYFHRIFSENNRDHLILIMHGVSYQNLQDLVELIYKGNVDVLPESLNPLYELAGEFQLSGISGILRDESDYQSCFNSNSSFGRDTRYKGQKRVAVDYNEAENAAGACKRDKECNEAIKKLPSKGPDDLDYVKSEDSACDEVQTLNLEDAVHDGAEEAPKLSAWAKKQRKFKCDLCPSSFKRSSHLSRHQLVHTGERPFACDQCDKAFSRHDKLKHHIRKTHENDYETDYSVDLQHPVRGSTPSPLPFVISHVRSEANDEEDSCNPPKRPRGRPRKYPFVPKPVSKRGRGRPRLNPPPSEANGENYDITNLPYGDLEYLTMSIQDDSVMIEPFVEIKTEKDETGVDDKNKEASKSSEKEDHLSTSPNSLKILENRIAKIGECTISVANH